MKRQHIEPSKRHTAAGLTPSRKQMTIPARLLLAAALIVLGARADAGQIGRQDVAFGYAINTCSGLSSGNGRDPGDVYALVEGEHECNSAQGSALDSQAAAASSHFNTTEQTSGKGEATATWGLLRLSSEYSGPNTARFPMAAATGGWVDTLRIDALDPSHQGRAGILNVLVQLDGFLQVTGPRSGASVTVATYANDLPFSQGRATRGIATDISPSSVELAIDQLVSLQVPFFFGTEFEWSLFADAVTRTVVRSSRTTANTGLSNFANTLTWQGFGDVTRLGQAVDYRLTAASGINWTRPIARAVPAPDAWALMAAGLVVVAIARSRRRGDRSSG